MTGTTIDWNGPEAYSACFFSKKPAFIYSFVFIFADSSRNNVKSGEKESAEMLIINTFVATEVQMSSWSNDLVVAGIGFPIQGPHVQNLGSANAT